MSPAACYGILCPKHRTCSLYAAVEGTPVGKVVGTCDPGDRSRPGFVPIVEIKETK